MTQHKVKLVCWCTMPWKTGISLRGRVELFTTWWVSCCWIPKRDDAKNEKNDYKTDEGNRKGKYKHLFWCNFICIRKIFHSLLNTYKNSYKLLITRVSCSDEFFIKRLISSKRKKRKGLIPLISYVCTIMNSFVFFFMIHEATRYTRYQSYRQHKGDTMAIKS